MRLRSPIDWSFFAGVAAIALLALVAIYGPLVAPHDQFFRRALLDGKPPPFPPSPEFIFGSDAAGRDWLSMLLIGARQTLAVAFGAAALRVGVGTTLGVLAGYGGGLVAAMFRRIALGLSSVPGTIAAVLGVLALGSGPGPFVLALGLVGWAEPFHQAHRYTRAISGLGYVETARSVGAPDHRLLLRHVLPNVAPALLTVAAFQVSAVLLLLGELAILRLTIGGFDWAGMLASTRPIVSLYGDLARVLVPAVALLVAVVATNLFGDALAARAQRLDVFRLFGRRELAFVAVLGLAVVTSLAVWPSRLAAELHYADAFDVDIARIFAATLTEARAGGADDARIAAMMAEHLGGEVVRGTDATPHADAVRLEVDGRSLTLGPDLSAVALDSGHVTGPLVYTSSNGVNTPTELAKLDGAIVVLRPAFPDALGQYVQLAATASARAVIVFDSGFATYPVRAALYPIPVARVSPYGLTQLLGHAGPDPLQMPLAVTALAASATLDVHASSRPIEITDVVARVAPAEAGAPLVLVVANYDAGSEGAAAVLAGVVRRVRAQPLRVEVIAIGTTHDDRSLAGLRQALARSDIVDVRSALLVFMVGSVGDVLVQLRAEAESFVFPWQVTLAARVAEAVGTTYSVVQASDATRALRASQVSAPLVTLVSARGTPSADVLRHAGRTLLTSLAYVPSHEDELH